MRASRAAVFMAVIVFVLGVTAIGDVAAGQKVRHRTVWYTVKWEQIDVPGEEGHLIGVLENKGIETVFEGKILPDGSVARAVGLVDVNTKTGEGSLRAYREATDSDGDKRYDTYEGKRVSDTLWEGEWTTMRGTGKYEGITGKGTWRAYIVAPGQSHCNWEGELELP